MSSSVSVVGIILLAIIAVILFSGGALFHKYVFVDSRKRSSSYTGITIGGRKLKK